MPEVHRSVWWYNIKKFKAFEYFCREKHVGNTSLSRGQDKPKETEKVSLNLLLKQLQQQINESGFQQKKNTLNTAS